MVNAHDAVGPEEEEDQGEEEKTPEEKANLYATTLPEAQEDLVTQVEEMRRKSMQQALEKRGLDEKGRPLSGLVDTSDTAAIACGEAESVITGDAS